MPITFTHCIRSSAPSAPARHKPAIDQGGRRSDRCGIDRYAVLVFRQTGPLTTEQETAFTLNFGEQEAPYTQIQAAQGVRWTIRPVRHIKYPPSGGLLDRDDRKRLSGLGNQMWHSDSSYKVIPARYSLLCAHVLPPEGGDTRFADMRAAYDM